MHMTELYQTLESQEKSASSGPYNISSPVTGSQFFGRETLLSSILEMLASANPGPVLIFGAARMGKTSLLQELLLRLPPSDYLPIYWGAKDQTDMSPQAVWESLAETIARPVGASASKLPSDLNLFRTRFLPQIRKSIAPRRLVLLLDDIDLLADAPAETHTLIEELQQLLAEEHQTAFVLTIGTKLQDLPPTLQSFEPPLFYEELPPLSSQEAFLLIIEESKAFLIGFLAKTIDRIWELAAGHPYYIQLIGHEILDYALKEGKQQIDLDSLAEVLPLILEKSAPDFRSFTANLSKPTRNILKASAAAYRQQLPITSESVRLILDHNRLTLDDNTLADSLAELQKLAVLDENEPGSFTFTLPLMAYWLFEQYPLQTPTRTLPTPWIQPQPSPRRKLALGGGGLLILLVALIGFGILGTRYNALTATAPATVVNAASSGETPTTQAAITLTATERPISAAAPTATSSPPAPTPLALLPTTTATPPLTPTVAPTTPATPTAVPPFTPSPAPTLTPTVPPPTATPLPTFTALPVAPLPPPTATPLPSPTAPAPPKQTPALPAGSFILLNPLALDQPSYGPTEFEWQWTGPIPPGTGFEVRVWREGEPQMGVHDAVYDNQHGNIESLGKNKYRLKVDITGAAGVQGLRGEYWWTVALVQVSPNYADLGQEAPPARMRFEPKGNSDGGGGGGSSGSSGGVGVK